MMQNNTQPELHDNELPNISELEAHRIEASHTKNLDCLHISIPHTNTATIADITAYTAATLLCIHPLTITNYLVIGRAAKRMLLAQLEANPDEIPYRGKSHLNTADTNWESLSIDFWHRDSKAYLPSITRFCSWTEVVIQHLTVHDLARLRWAIAGAVRDLLRREGDKARQELLQFLPAPTEPWLMYCQSCGRAYPFNPPDLELAECQCGGRTFSRIKPEKEAK